MSEYSPLCCGRWFPAVVILSRMGWTLFQDAVSTPCGRPQLSHFLPQKPRHLPPIPATWDVATEPTSPEYIIFSLSQTQSSFICCELLYFFGSLSTDKESNILTYQETEETTQKEILSPCSLLLQITWIHFGFLLCLFPFLTEVYWIKFKWCTWCFTGHIPSTCFSKSCL